ncbi:hypothetical protein JCM8208_006983 [Rhodotorula glutinis]
MVPRIVVHATPLDLLRAVEEQPHGDSVRTNHGLGFVFARWLETCSPTAARPGKGAGEADKPDENVEVLVTASDGDHTRLIFTKLGWARCKLLLVDAFLARWPHPRKLEPNMMILPASTRTAPPTVVFLPYQTLTLIRDVDVLSRAELLSIGNLLITFYGRFSTTVYSPDGLAAHARSMVARGAFWLYCAPRRAVAEDGVERELEDEPARALEPVAFLETGRPTLRTCAIRMVYVSPSYRCRGVAQRMVSAVVRAHLVEAPRLPFDLAHRPRVGETEEPLTRFGRKDEVCLSVEPGNTNARRAYAKVGFEESGDVWADVDLEGVEPGYW